MNAPLKLRVNWEAHVEALPLATWIISRDAQVADFSIHDGSPERLRGCEQVFLNQACRDLLGFGSNGSPAATCWQRYLHPDDRPACLVAWRDFIEGRTPRFSVIVRWIRPDSKDLGPTRWETISLAVRAQRLLCGDIQGWLRPTRVEQALSRLAELL